MWAYAMDALALLPPPDFLILADECSDFHHSFDLNDEFLSSHSNENVPMEEEIGVSKKRCEVVNPGNFSHDLSFLALYPNNVNESIQLSKLP